MNNTNNEFYKLRADLYNNNKERSRSSDIAIETETRECNPKYYNTRVVELTDLTPYLSLEYTGNEYIYNTNRGGVKINNGFDCLFKVDTAFFDNTGNNGCLGFAWSNASLGENAVPDNYTELGEKGLLGASLYGLKGVALTLFPDTEDIDDTGYTTKVSHSVLFYKPEADIDTGFMSTFDFNSIDLYAYNLLSVRRDSDGYKFYLNNAQIGIINKTGINIDDWEENEGYFTAAILSEPFIEANLEIVDISDNDIHLDQKEKLNLGNLGVSVKTYDAIGDGVNDDTAAFIQALANHSRVYVPGGKYRITGELTVRDNCELELARDAVLDFDPAYFEVTIDANRDTITRNVNSPMTVNDVSDDPETFRCIILKMSSSLIGNRATIRVPYDFKGSVIYASTRSHPTGESVRSFEPFSRWDPQWKPARYLKDINITKPIEKGMTVKVLKTDIEIEQIKALKGSDFDPNVDIYKYSSLDGFHASIKNACYGTAVFIEGYRSPENEGSTFIWGLDYSGLRIAGAFNYGIYGKNNYQPTVDDWSWTYDMKVNAIIDGCKAGVYLDHCSNSRISAIIQPRTAYFDVDDENKPPYAEYGIYLNECTNVDLTGSRVWDWDATHTLWAFGNENQHLRLKGDCKGLILDDFKYYANGSYNLRDLIKVDDEKYLNNITILQEPVSKFIRFEKEPVDGIESSMFNKTYLQNRVYVKKEFVVGLEQELQNLSQRIMNVRSALGLPIEEQ